MSDFLFEGGMDFVKAYDDFLRFLKNVESQINNTNSRIAKAGANSQSGNDSATKAQEEKQRRLDEVYAKAADAVEKSAARIIATQQRIRDAMEAGTISTASGQSQYNALDKQLERHAEVLRVVELREEENVQVTNGHIVALRKFEEQLGRTDQYLQRVESGLAASNETFKQGASFAEKYFKGLVVGGFALQQLGGFLEADLTQPFVKAGKSIFDTLLIFDEFQEVLSQTAGKSVKEIANIRKIAEDVAKRPNITLEETVELFERLEQITKGNILPKQLEEIGKGLTVAFQGTPERQRKNTLAEIMSAIASPEGGTANLNKVLNNAVLLKEKIVEIINAPITDANIAAAGFNQQSVILKALGELANETPAKTLRNQFDNIGDAVTQLAAKIGESLKPQVEELFNYINDKVLPMLNDLADWFANSPKWIQDTVLGITAAVAALGPILALLGTITVVAGGVIYLIESLAGIFAALTGSTVATAVAGEGLNATLASSGGLLTGLGAIIGDIIEVFTVLGTAATVAIGGILVAIGAVIAAAVYAVATFKSVQVQLANLMNALGDGVKDLGSVLLNLGKIAGELITIIIKLLSYPVAAGLIVAFKVLADVVTLLNLPLKVVAIALQFITDVMEGTGTAMIDFQISVQELNISVMELIPGLESFYDWVRKISGSKALSPREQLQALKDQKAALMQHADATSDDEKQVLRLKEANENTTKSVEKLTEMLERQNKRLLESAAAAREARLAQANAEADNAGKAAAFDSQQVDEHLDLLTPEGQTTAAKNIASRSKAELEAELRRIKLAEVKAQADWKTQLVSDLQGLVLVNKQLKLAVDTVTATAINRKPQDIIDYLINSANAVGTDEGRLLSQSISRANATLQNTYDALAANRDKINQIIEAKREADIKLQEKIKEAGRQYMNQANASTTNSFIEAEQLGIDKLELDITELDKLGITYTEKMARLKDALDKIALAKTRIAAAQRDLAIASLKPEDKTLGEQKAGDDFNKSTDNINQDTTKRMAKAAQDVKNSAKDAAQIQVAATVALNIVKTNQDNLNTTLKDIQSKQGIALSNLSTLPEATAETLAKVVGLDDDLRKMQESLSSFSKLKDKLNETMAQAGLQSLFEKEIPRFTGENASKTVGNQINYLKDVIAKILSLDLNALKLDDKDNQYESTIALLKQATDALQKLQGIQKEMLATGLDNSRQRKEANIVNKEYELNSKKNALELLELQQQINETIRARNIGNSGGFVKSIMDILTDGRKAANEMENKRLDSVIQIQKLETDIAVMRLEVEQDITNARLQADKADTAQIKKYNDLMSAQIKAVKQRGELENQQVEEQRRTISKYGTTITGVLTTGISAALDKVFNKKKKAASMDERGASGSLAGLVLDDNKQDEPAISDDATKKTGDNAKEQMSWLDKLTGKMGTVRDATMAFGEALEQLNELSLQSILKTIKAELDALYKKALIKALEYSAIAIGALVFGDVSTAGKAAAAAASWATVAGAAKIGSAVTGLGIKKDEQVAQTKSNQAAGTSSDTETQKRIAKQQAYEFKIMLDIRTDKGVQVKQQIEALNKNTKLTTLTQNSQTGWSFPSTP